MDFERDEESRDSTNGTEHDIVAGPYDPHAQGDGSKEEKDGKRYSYRDQSID